MCSSGCPTPGAHKTWGECVRAKRTLTSSPAAVEYHKFNDGEVNAFFDAAHQGILPASTRRADVDYAVKKSEETGKPFRADQM